MSGRVDLAVERWRRFQWTRALLAVDPEGAAAALAEAVRRGAPLAGRLFSVKDLYATAGLPSTAGSLLLAGYVPARDAVAVARLRRAGAALFAKGHCAEFGFGVDATATRIGGAVRHPAGDGVSVGGSSGGDAVAVATGIVDIALAGDYGGSVRWPAQAVGVCGLRTGAGVVPRTGRMPGCGASPQDPVPGPPNPWSLAGALETVGILTRSVAEMAAAVPAVAGADGEDWWGLEGPRPAGGPLCGRLAFSAAPEVAPVTDEVREALARARDAASAEGFEVLDATGILDGAFEVYTELRARLDDHADLRRLVAGREDLLCEETAAVLDAAGPRPDAGRTARLWAQGRSVARRVRDLLGTVDALVLPVAPCGPVPSGAAVSVAGRSLTATELMAHCRAVSLTGLPALSVPVVGDRRTVSVQIVGGPGGELRCCQVAERIGARLGRAWAAGAPSAGST